MKTGSKRIYSKQPAKLPSKVALQELASGASKPGSTIGYAKATPLGQGGLDAPSIDDWMKTPGTGL